MLFCQLASVTHTFQLRKAFEEMLFISRNSDIIKNCQLPDRVYCVATITWNKLNEEIKGSQNNIEYNSK